MPGQGSVQLLRERKLQALHHFAKLVQRIFLLLAHKKVLHPLAVKLMNHRGKGTAHRLQRKICPLGKKAHPTIRGHHILGNNSFTESELIQGNTPDFFHSPIPSHKKFKSNMLTIISKTVTFCNSEKPREEGNKKEPPPSSFLQRKGEALFLCFGEKIRIF
jgi:hypothetical protein